MEQRTIEDLASLFWGGKCLAVLAHLQRLRPTSGKAPVPFERASTVWKRRGPMGNDQDWRDRGYAVGSGMVERGVAVIIKFSHEETGNALGEQECHGGDCFTRPQPQLGLRSTGSLVPDCW